MRRLFLVVAAAAFATPVTADDGKWSGLYIGAHGGYGWGDVSVVDTDGGVPYGAFEYSAEGAFGGGTAGFNLQFSNFVVGIEGDVGYMDLDGSKIIASSSSPTHHQDLTVDGGMYGLIAGRVGVALAERTLVYAKGGYAYFDGEALQQTTKPWYEATGTDSFQGWAYGGGIEHMLGRGWSLKLEYLHFDFDPEGGVQEKVSTVGADDNGVNGTPVGYKFHNEHDLDVDTVKIGINYKFGGRSDSAVPLK